MSDPAQPLPPTPATSLPPERIAELFATYNNTRLRKTKGLDGSVKWTNAALELMEHGLIPDERPKPAAPAASAAEPYSPGKPYSEWEQRQREMKLVGAGAPREERRRRGVFAWAAEVEREEVRWLWPDRIPFDTVSMLAGIPGDGKSSLALERGCRGAPRGPTGPGSSWSPASRSCSTPR
jgi:hypothetical protein